MNQVQWLAVPLAFALACVLAFPFSSRLISYRWAQATNDVNNVALELGHMPIPFGQTEVDVVQRWLAGKTLGSDPRVFQMAPPPESDPWGNPLQAVERSDVSGKMRVFAVFSFGRDGTSATNGDDPDDINSWSDDPVAYYRRETQKYRLLCVIPWAIILCVPTWFLLRTRRETEPSVPERV